MYKTLEPHSFWSKVSFRVDLLQINAKHGKTVGELVDVFSSTIHFVGVIPIWLNTPNSSSTYRLEIPEKKE